MHLPIFSALCVHPRCVCMQSVKLRTCSRYSYIWGWRSHQRGKLKQRSCNTQIVTDGTTTVRLCYHGVILSLLGLHVGHVLGAMTYIQTSTSLGLVIHAKHDFEPVTAVWSNNNVHPGGQGPLEDGLANALSIILDWEH